MKKETNTGLFFMMALGIVGLGFYFGSTDTYSAGELQFYHIICWIVLILALIRMLEVMWRPLKQLWLHLWEKSQEEMQEEHDRTAATQRDIHTSSMQNNIHIEDEVIIPSREVLTQEEMQTAIIVPESSQRVYAETIRKVQSLHKDSDKKKKKKKKKK